MEEYEVTQITDLEQHKDWSLAEKMGWAGVIKNKVR